MIWNGATDILLGRLIMPAGMFGGENKLALYPFVSCT